MKTPAAVLLLLVLHFPPVLAQFTPNPAAGSTSPTPQSPQASQPSQAAQKPDVSIPTDDAKQWVVGFSALVTEGLSTENGYLAYSLPLLLKDQVSGLVTHTLSAEEKDGIRREILAGAGVAAEQAITKVRGERDLLLFGDSAPSASSRQAIESRLDAAQARAGFLQSLDPSQVDIASDKPVSFKEGTGAGNLLDPPQVPIATYCARESIDLEVGGSLREVQGYLLLDLWVFDAGAGSIVRSLREVAQRDELYAAMPSLGRDLVGIILGRDWALVSFVPDPPDASLSVDGVAAASGSTPFLYLQPGTREITVSAPGWKDQSRTITLEPGTETRLAVALEKESAGSVALSSEPPGARVYLDAIWQGTTPLLLERPAVRSGGVLALQGFYDLSFSVGADSPAQMSFPLQKDLGERDPAQRKARDDFYASFAWFALSVPLPVFCYAFSIDYSLQGQAFLARGMSNEAASAQVASNVFLGGYYAGIALGGSLFTWMVLRIIHYASVASGAGS